MNAFKDHFSGHAADYRSFRPEYPPTLFAFLADHAPGRVLAWDCGTGNGQAAVALAGHFDKVFATDASAEQIRNADPHPRVEYAVAPAEACPLPDHSADLVAVAQALHWFDFPRFYAEVRRVAKSGGLVAAWSYHLHGVNTDIDRLLARLQTEFVGMYWPSERGFVDEEYRTIPFPFPEVPAPTFEMTAEWDLPRMLGYMNTWSSTKAYTNAHGVNPVEAMASDFAAEWGNPATVRTVRWPFHLRVGRVC
jgi:SAM-dependent methyltransferase